jgi:hypothetical protein
MCFSAEASFVVSAGLITSGFAIHRFKIVEKHEQALAAIPFVFGLQQFSEGLVWLGLDDGLSPLVHTSAIYFFTFVAFTFWPIYAAFAMYQFERSKIRKYIIPFQFIGIAVGFYLLWCYTYYSDLSLLLVENGYGKNSLSYYFELPGWDKPVEYFYLAASTFPFFITKNRGVRWIIGPIMLLSFPLGKYMSNVHTFPSVWCLIAAVASIGIYHFAFKSKK